MRLSDRSVRLSLLVAVAAFVLDRAHKYAQIDIGGWVGGEIVPVTPFFDYMLVWNTGISYGLFGAVSPEVLIAVMLAAIVGLSIWWVKDETVLVRVGIALAIGGALSNLVDRVIYGAVADFFHFHVGSFSWYVFNIADVAITAGVLMLVADVFRPRRAKA